MKVVESEKTAKWQYTRHCEDLSVEIKKLREEVRVGTVAVCILKQRFILKAGMQKNF